MKSISHYIVYYYVSFHNIKYILIKQTIYVFFTHKSWNEDIRALLYKHSFPTKYIIKQKLVC